jgi:Divergent InlB B-repeat domain
VPRALVVVAALAALALLAPRAEAANPQLRAQVGPGYVISLEDADGTSLDGATIAPGTYDIVVVDSSSNHNFHLQGPGFTMATSEVSTANVTWTVTFAPGQSWHFQCDPHSDMMFGDFQIGSAPPPPPTQHPLAVVVSGAGTVTSTPAAITCPGTCNAQFAAGASVSLAAAPAAGSTVTWSGACSGAGACSVTMNGPKTVGATFTAGPPPATHLLTVTTAGAGSGTVTSAPAAIDCGATCTATFVEGTVVALTATPAPGSTFDGWSGACSGTGACNVAMTGARALTATFRRLPGTPPPPNDPYSPPTPAGTPPPPSPALQNALPAVTVRGFRAQVRVIAATRRLVLHATLGRKAPAVVQLLRRGRQVARWQRTLRKGESTLALVIPRSVKAGRYAVKLTCGKVGRTTQVSVPKAPPAVRGS